MNKLIVILIVGILCSACEFKKDHSQLKEMNYICSSLAKGYLKISQFDSYEMWNKEDRVHGTIQFLYTKSHSTSQMVVNPPTKLLECKKEREKYLLSEIDQRSLKKINVLTLVFDHLT
jgi:hypothetical protein